MVFPFFLVWTSVWDLCHLSSWSEEKVDTEMYLIRQVYQSNDTGWNCAVTCQCRWTKLVAKLQSPISAILLRRDTRGVLVFLKFGQFSSELTKTWSSGATECDVWIGKCNVKVWKSTEHKLHKIWRSLKFCVNSRKRAHPRDVVVLQNFCKIIVSTRLCGVCAR